MITDYIDVLSSVVLALITGIYVYITLKILKQSKKDTQIAYISKRLENYYYPLYSFFDYCKIEINGRTEKHKSADIIPYSSEKLADMSFEKLAAISSEILVKPPNKEDISRNDIKAIHFNSANLFVFTEIDNYQYLGRPEIKKELYNFEEMLNKNYDAMKKTSSDYKNENKTICNPIRKNPENTGFDISLEDEAHVDLFLKVFFMVFSNTKCLMKQLDDLVK